MESLDAIEREMINHAIEKMNECYGTGDPECIKAGDALKEIIDRVKSEVNDLRAHTQSSWPFGFLY